MPPPLLPVLPLAVLLFVSCARSPAQSPASSLEPRSLSGPWAFHPGDDAQWAAPAFDDRGWTRIQVPQSWRRQGFEDLTGLAWYRSRVPSPGPAEDQLGITLGKIDSAYEVYVGGRKLGGVGELPPAPRMEYDRHRTYSIPASAREADGSVVIALRVWREPRKISTAAGPVEGPFEIGPLERLIERAKLSESQHLGLLLLFLLVAIYHFTLRLQLGSGADYAWFGVLALLATIYGLLRTQWKYLLFDDFLVMKKIEHMAVWLVPAVSLEFLWVFFNEPRPRWLRIAQTALVAGAVTVAITPGLIITLALLQVLQFSIFPLLFLSLVVIARRVRVRNWDAIMVGIGMAALTAAIVHDFLVDRSYLVQPRLSIYGFAVLVAGMSVTLANRFQRALRERDAMMLELESRVDIRTRELSEAYRAMEDLALHDGLTQVMNRRAIRDRAANELTRARRHGVPFAIALVDIDHFKEVNDTYGHAAGDQVLVQLARRLGDAVRASDAVGRWGGEEFMVLMPGAARREAVAAAERIRTLMAGTPVTIGDKVVQDVTVSIGLMAVDVSGAEALDLDTLITHADEALYRAKAEGRNAARIAAL